MQAELLLPARALLGEGPLWIPEQQRLYWLDIEARQLHRSDPATGDDETFSLSSVTGCLTPCKTGNFLLASGGGIEEVRFEERRLVTVDVKAHPEAGMTGTRYNDGKCSPEGRFWFGTLSLRRQAGEASLYVLDDRGCRKVLGGATNSNGLGWSPDGRTFYWIDTPTRRIEAFDYEPNHGELSNRRSAVVFPGDDEDGRAEWGRPDGMTVDAAGMIWVAHWMGARVTRWNPATGTLLDEIRLPVSRVTSVTFGGPDLETLFITSARNGMTPEELDREPESGGLYTVKPCAVGLPPARFRF